MIAYWCIGVVCLVTLMSGAHACCEPDAYKLQYEIEVSGVASSHLPGETDRIFESEIHGAGFVDWTRETIHQELTGVIKAKLGEKESSVELSAVVSVNNGKQLWMRLEAPALGQTMCKTWKVKGGIPEHYQCLTDSYEEVGPNLYDVPSESVFLQQVLEVTDICTPKRFAMNLNDSINGHYAYLELRVTDFDPIVDLTSGELPDVPEDCELEDEEVELPSSFDNIRIAQGIMAKRDIFDEGLKRLAREIGEMVKRVPSKSDA